ncbi:putative tRNA wybutosine-synthesizing protein 1-like [Apostichopus japonicus]|uniref:S-adenosyl-L-methionine-dependent tRNA 4-demethylwyosine synthase TYW1 n=1 Tax=Stichopus japonicus TaxID=307972 RepID=A0A2G8KUJ3_STIJA|nr:putative tRNA wybutosine-synthesizing protein 1-like [Apostichopus japonicus]
MYFRYCFVGVAVVCLTAVTSSVLAHDVRSRTLNQDNDSDTLSRLFYYLQDWMPCCHGSAYIAGAMVLLCTIAFVNTFLNRQEKPSSPSSQESSTSSKAVESKKEDGVSSGNDVWVFYGTQTGTAQKFADSLKKKFVDSKLGVRVIDLKTFDPEQHILPDFVKTSTLVFIISTYTDGQPPESAAWFYNWLEESVNDFRVPRTLLSGVKYSVFGLGNSLYKENYNKVSRSVDVWMKTLHATPVLGRGYGDANVANSKHGGAEGDFDVWAKKIVTLLKAEGTPNGKTVANGVKAKIQEEEEEETQEEVFEDEDDDIESSKNVLDVEDLGVMMKSSQKKNEAGDSTKEMVTPMIRQSLTKQGYKLIGSHSGVKLCRWTKSMLRGRGGCYKHTFYGIESHRCMETTPSLACANKCVFCWRHHTNPVGTEWKWKMDQPDVIVKGAMENHYKLINQFKGVPGVKDERMQEAMKIKHCALSLVGEPIMYPEINTLVRMLHGHEISTFLVTNAQFPNAIKQLLPVTQLYVSVDASTKDSLKKIDRPLFKDFWQRFLDSLRALLDKGQRTVYRLTIVKSWNSEEIEGYAELVDLGKPDFIEIKGVTYCGESKASTLTMQNVPWHEEVLGFVQNLVDLLPDYELACEHEHSNCVLLANKKFKIEGRWHTWIDYTMFHKLMRKFEESKGQESFCAEDYMAETPSWACYGSEERGFDPEETRFRRKNKKQDISGC